MLVWQKEKSTPSCRVAIAGDFLPASGLQLPPNRTWSDVAAGFHRYFAKVHVAIMNLECCVDVGDAEAQPKMGLGDSFSADAEVLDFPEKLGAKIIGLANNHIYDFGEEGVARTRQALLSRGLVPLGVGRTLADPPQTCLAETPTGQHIGVWAAARHLADLATRRKPGIEPATRRRGEEALAELRKQNADLTIAFLHAGLERTNRPDPDDVALMDDLAKIGFDVVAACHSHRISGYKRVIRGDGSTAFCFYGLGSVSSGVIYSSLEREGLVVTLGLSDAGKLLQVDANPVHLEGSGWGRIPLFGDAYTALTRFLQVSEEIASGAYKQKFYGDLRGDFFRKYYRDIQVAVQNGGMRGLATKLGRIRMRHLNRVLQRGLG
jgi:poly-gamma-glutamate capsule biosynthesis protein CapA/YwtB (metallophosphatase superfamily)